MKTEKIYRLLMRLYHFFFGLDLKYNKLSSVKNNVYDHYGAIDTLGDRSDCGFFTSSYSEELGSIYRIHLPFGFRIEMSNYDEKEIFFYRNRKGNSGKKVFRYLLKSSSNISSSVYKTWYYHGNILFTRNAIKPWFNYTGAALHILGFRFSSHIGVLDYWEVVKKQKHELERAK